MIASPLERLRFDNRFVRLLPGDPETRNFRRQVHKACYSWAPPTPVPAPRVIGYSREMLAELDLDEAAVDGFFAEVFSGNRLLPGMQPFAMCYGGHQFGTWAGQLGDGRAINLAEVINRRGVRWVLQLKGAGPTPYSRSADGLAVLRSSLREFLCSEAMEHLGIPTTRALSLVVTGQNVLRDMFYDGHPQLESGAIVCRAAPSFLRFGNFEIFAARKDEETLRRLIAYAILTDDPQLFAAANNPLSNGNSTDGIIEDRIIVRWFQQICRRTAELIVRWMGVGFVHGVMNTDNMSILGLTIDYGPYGWIEEYDPAWTPNTTDAEGRRYCYGNQPEIGMWNLVRLAEALLLVCQDRSGLQEGIDLYAQTFHAQWDDLLARKLGLASLKTPAGQKLVEELWDLLADARLDVPIFFRRLAKITPSGGSDLPVDQLASHPGLSVLEGACYEPSAVQSELRLRIGQWLRSYQQRLASDGLPESQRTLEMNRVNPKYLLRNYLAQLAIDRATTGDFEMIQSLLEVLRRPYDEQETNETWSAKRPDWARDRPGCAMLSCSS